MADPITQPQRQGLLGGFFGPQGRDTRQRLALALEGLTQNPNQALIGQIQTDMQGRETARQNNATAAWLRSRGRDDLAQAMMGGLPAAEAMRIAMMPAAKPEIREVGGKLVSVSPDGTVSELYAPTAEPAFRRATPEEAAAYGATSGQFGPDGRFYEVDVPQGMTIESDGQGGFRLVQGPAGATGSDKPFTEGQSKDVVYATRAKGALEVLEPVAENLTSLAGQVSSMDPTGIIRRRVQTPDFQVAQNAGNEFLQAILRKDTGAAITSQEQALYGETYLPRPGDGPEVLVAKQAARQRAVAAIEAGMSPAQMIAQEKALSSSQTTPASGGVVTIASDAEYEALPSGTTFVGPDGKTRRKP
jgi:hypothetical protein